MTGNVVQFPPPDQLIYVCDCGCQSFRLYPSAAVECANCGLSHTVPDAVGEWLKQLPDLPETITRTDAGTITVKALRTPDFARAQVLRDLNDWAKSGELELIVGYRTDGNGKNWSNVQTQDQKEWVLRKLRQLTAHIEQSKVYE